MASDRVGCCADWPKPCSYHEGYQDALDESSRHRDLLERVAATPSYRFETVKAEIVKELGLT